MFFSEMTGFFSLLLWAGSAVCFLAFGLDTGDETNLYLGVVLTLVTFLTGCSSFYQSSKSAAIIAEFKNFAPPLCNCYRDGELKQIEAKLLVRGDIVEIKAGDRIPADLRVIESNELKVDNSAMACGGEQLRTPEFTNDNPLETKNMVFYGTLCKSGKAKTMVITTGDNTVMGCIAKLTTDTENKETSINIEIMHFIKIVSGVAMFLGLSFFIIGMIIDIPWINNVVFMIGIIVANVEEGFLATVTVCLSLAAIRMTGKNVLVKNLESVETLGSTTCIPVFTDLSHKNTKCDLSKLPYDPTNPTFINLSKISSLCSNTVINYDIPPEKECTKQKRKQELNDVGKLQSLKKENQVLCDKEVDQMRLQNKPMIGDATKTGICKFLWPIKSISDNRN